jgi:Ni/Fe-hydrogenase subunit HybB-like protein
MSTNLEVRNIGKDLMKAPIRTLKRHPLLSISVLVSFLLLISLVYYRFSKGLGVTGLNDLAPWGLWTALKLSFVMAAGCGFTLTCMVYIFKMESFRPLVRSATLMGLLGYASFVFTLILELGWPWRIVHPIWLHNYRSILFEVAWCVILYLLILIFEVLPNIFEKFKMFTLQRIFHKLTPSFVIIGVVLSVLHQSSLGSLFVMLPYKMNHLWYSPWLGPFFIISAIFGGFALVILSELLMSTFGKRKPHMKILSNLGRYSVPFLGLYLGFKIMDVIERVGARSAFATLDIYSILFVTEIILGILFPIFLYGSKRVRLSKTGLGITASLVLLFGGVLNRLNVSVLSINHSPLGYKPNYIEFLYIPLIIMLLFGIYVILTRILPIYKSGYNVESHL